MKKRAIALALSALMITGLVGCGSKTEDNSQAAADNSTTPATEADTEESTEAAGGAVGTAQLFNGKALFHTDFLLKNGQTYSGKLQ